MVIIKTHIETYTLTEQVHCLLNCIVHFLIRLAFSCVSLRRHRQSWRLTLAAAVVIDVKLVFKLAVGCGAVPTEFRYCAAVAG